MLKLTIKKIRKQRVEKINKLTIKISIVVENCNRKQLN